MFHYGIFVASLRAFGEGGDEHVFVGRWKSRRKEPASRSASQDRYFDRSTLFSCTSCLRPTLPFECARCAGGFTCHCSIPATGQSWCGIRDLNHSLSIAAHQCHAAAACKRAAGKLAPSVQRNAGHNKPSRAPVARLDSRIVHPRKKRGRARHGARPDRDILHLRHRVTNRYC